MSRPLLAGVLLAFASACGAARDPSLDELASTMRASTPPEQRMALDADLDALAKLSRESRLGTAERDAIVELFRSATRDGSLDEDERTLLGHLVRDVVAAGGNLPASAPVPSVEKPKT